MTWLPALLGVAGTMVALAGVLIALGRRRRGFVGVGLLLVLAGVTIVAPQQVYRSAQTAAATTAGLIGGHHDEAPAVEVARAPRDR